MYDVRNRDGPSRLAALDVPYHVPGSGISSELLAQVGNLELGLFHPVLAKVAHAAAIGRHDLFH